MTTVAIIVLVVVVLAIVAVVAYALSTRRAYRAANQIVPGHQTDAPAAWAGAHSPEALLHRRLRDALAALHQRPRRDEPSFLDLSGRLAAQALAVDERLMVVAALPEGARAEPLAAAAAAVAGVEDAVVTLALAMTPGEPGLEQATADLTERFRYIESARAELERSFPSTPVDSLPTEQETRKIAGPEATG